MSHADHDKEDAQGRIHEVAKELLISLLFVAGALGVYWLLRLFPGGKPPVLVYVFVIISDLGLITGATIEFVHALRTLAGSARDGRAHSPKAHRTWRVSVERDIGAEPGVPASNVRHVIDSPTPRGLPDGSAHAAIAPAPHPSDGPGGQPASSNEPEPRRTEPEPRRTEPEPRRTEPESRTTTGTGEVAPNVGYWAVTLRGPDGRRYPQRVVRANIEDPDSFRSHLIGIARVEALGETDAGEQWIGRYELEVRKPGTDQSSPDFVTLRWDASPEAGEPPSPREPADDHVAKVVDIRRGRRLG